MRLGDPVGDGAVAEVEAMGVEMTGVGTMGVGAMGAETTGAERSMVKSLWDLDAFRREISTSMNMLFNAGGGIIVNGAEGLVGDTMLGIGLEDINMRGAGRTGDTMLKPGMGLPRLKKLVLALVLVLAKAETGACLLRTGDGSTLELVEATGAVGRWDGCGRWSEVFADHAKEK